MIIVTGQLEAYPMAVPKRITAGYPPPHTADVLVDDRLVFDNLAAGNAYNQVAVSIEPQPIGAVEAEFDLPRVGARLRARSRTPVAVGCRSTPGSRPDRH